MNPLKQSPPPLPSPPRNESVPQRISVVDFDMPFGRMIVFMIKWAFAAIPALVIIWTVLFVLFLIATLFFSSIAALSHH
jgi:hypothetical protein